MHASDEDTLAQLLHGDRDQLNIQEANNDGHVTIDPVPGPAIDEEMQPLRSKDAESPKKKGKSHTCAIS